MDSHVTAFLLGMQIEALLARLMRIVQALIRNRPLREARDKPAPRRKTRLRR